MRVEDCRSFITPLRTPIATQIEMAVIKQSVKSTPVHNESMYKIIRVPKSLDLSNQFEKESKSAILLATPSSPRWSDTKLKSSGRATAADRTLAERRSCHLGVKVDVGHVAVSAIGQ